MYKLLKLSKITLVLNFFLYFAYNSYFGWNETPISNNEILLNSVFRINLYIACIMYILPLFSMYEGFVQLIEKTKNIEKSKNTNSN
jgi:amino acid transporter